MTITFNGEALAVDADTVADLLALRLHDPRPHGVAVAVNEEVVPRDDWPRWPLADGDVVEVVTAVQGG
ncbi:MULTISPECIES: sulfur carrier protein ThiS [Nocardioides]|uniref:Sulfur carrier protein ThiS n=1 Tax=Nocardioides vastitatis TaxID=2568655 RepID=A0ABW0ZDD5_9ACTN|nr:sulfur carrier protein ThiS [Nocardioides sp.]THI93247.1 sulfur carrier protein ThiS [Nocardioides sp.]